MIKNYFTIGYRNLLRHKGYSFINVGGLAVGMAVAMLIGLWVWDELSFNQYHKNYDDIAQVRRYFTDPNTHEKNGVFGMQYPMSALLKDNYKQYFKHVIMIWFISDYSLSTDNKKLKRKGEFMGSEGLDMLSLKMIKGNYSSLNDIHSIVLSKSTVEVFFGNDDPIGKTLKIDNRMDVVVTGVYEDIPKNSRYGEVQFFSPWNLWVASNDWIKQAQDNWGNSSFPILVQLQPNVSMVSANTAIKEFYYHSVPDEVATGMKQYQTKLFLYPMKDWHLYSDFKNGLPEGGRITFVWLFAIVGVFVLLLACINFMNLGTARSEKRAKEVGIRKAVGSKKNQLIYQFLSESFLVVILAFVLSVLLVAVSLSWFNDLADKNLSIPFSEPVFWIISMVFVAATGFLAGTYPAFYLSGFQPVKVLKGTLRLGRFAALPRKVLVVIQFTVSVVLIIGTLVVYKQIQFAKARPVGYNREGLITIPANDPNYIGKFDVLRNELINTGMVEGMELSSSPLTEVWNNSSDYDWSGKQPREYSFSSTNVSYGFGKMVGWQFIAGRDFSKDFATDSDKIVINETAAKDMVFKNPIGQFVRTGGGTKTWQIVGVIKDMVMGSPYEPEKRAIFFLDAKYEAASQIDIKIMPTVSAAEALPKIESVFKAIVPSAGFDYKFVDDEYARKFGDEQRIGKLSTFFSALAIFISCLGLFGLASFVAEQRTKELAVRKVLGATVTNLWSLLSKDFVVLVIISLLIASPITYYFMSAWLQKYTFHTEISVWIYLATSAGALCITLLTVSYQSIKVALANPVRSLRSE